MQEQHSTSTLNNYISGAQNNQDSSRHHHETSESCIECQHVVKIEKQSSSDSEENSSSGDDGELVQPLHRHIIEHSRQIQATITHLQQEIQKLKNANCSKDLLIEQLKKQLKQVQLNSKISQTMEEQAKEAEFLRREKQIENIRRQIEEKTQHFMNFNLMNSPISPTEHFNKLFGQKIVNEEMKAKLKNGQGNFEGKNKGSEKNVDANYKNSSKRISEMENRKLYEDESDSSSDSSQEIQKKQSKKQKISSSERLNSNRVQQNPAINQPKPPKPSSSKQKIKIQQKVVQTQAPAQSQKTTNNDKESSIEEELNQYSERITRLERHIQFCEEEMVWMTNFIISFLRMSEKLMGSFNEQVLREHWPMKKKTKIAWRYVKHILGYLIP